MPSTLRNGVHIIDHLALHQKVKERSTGFNKTSVLGAFAKLREQTTTFFTSVPVCLSIRPHGTTRTPVDGYLLNLMSQYFPKICRENLSFIKI